MTPSLFYRLITGVICAFVIVSIRSCEKSREEINSTYYIPLELDDWETASPDDLGLDTTYLTELYTTASEIGHLYSLLVLKEGYLIAERYFHGKDVTTALPVASVTKSFTSTLTGIALENGFLTGTDQTLAEFFPEFNWDSMDHRKAKITIDQLLKMRSGYPWEEFSDYDDLLWSQFGNWLPLLEEIPLFADPGTDYGYSNLMAHVLGIIVSRATQMSLHDFALEYLCEPLEIGIPVWWKDQDGYNYGHGDIHARARDLAKFGYLYQENGTYKGKAILSPEWVNNALTPYSMDIYGRAIFDHFSGLDFGYMNWFSSTSGNHKVYFSWGHGGQHIFLIPEYEMIIVTTADYMPGQDSEEDWKKQKAVTEMVGKYISRLH